MAMARVVAPKEPWMAAILSSPISQFYRFKSYQSIVMNDLRNKHLQLVENPHNVDKKVKDKQFKFNKKDMESEPGLWKVFDRWKRHYRGSKKVTNAVGQRLERFLA